MSMHSYYAVSADTFAHVYNILNVITSTRICISFLFSRTDEAFFFNNLFQLLRIFESLLKVLRKSERHFASIKLLFNESFSG